MLYRSGSYRHDNPFQPPMHAYGTEEACAVGSLVSGLIRLADAICCERKILLADL